MLDRTPCLRRWVASSTTSPNQVGVEATNSAEVWMITDPSAILVICASLREWGCFSLSKSHIFIPARYMLVARCASRGLYGHFPRIVTLLRLDEMDGDNQHFAHHCHDRHALFHAPSHQAPVVSPKGGCFQVNAS